MCEAFQQSFKLCITRNQTADMVSIQFQLISGILRQRIGKELIHLEVNNYLWYVKSSIVP